MKKIFLTFMLLFLQPAFASNNIDSAFGVDLTHDFSPDKEKRISKSFYEVDIYKNNYFEKGYTLVHGSVVRFNLFSQPISDSQVASEKMSSLYVDIINKYHGYSNFKAVKSADNLILFQIGDKYLKIEISTFNGQNNVVKDIFAVYNDPVRNKIVYTLKSLNTKYIIHMEYRDLNYFPLTNEENPNLDIKDLL